MSNQFLALSALLLLTGFAGAAEPAPLPPEQLNAIVRQMASVRSLSARFVQTKKIKNLRRELRISGTMCWDVAGRFSWQVEQPIRYSCILADGRLSQWDAESGKVIELDLKRHPAILSMFEMMRHFISGRSLAENSPFDIVFDPRRPDRLRLNAKAEFRKLTGVEALELELAADRRTVRRVRLEEARGNRTTLEFFDTAVNQPAPAGAWSHPVK